MSQSKGKSIAAGEKEYAIFITLIGKLLINTNNKTVMFSKRP